MAGITQADLSKAKSTTQGIGWTILRLPLTAFSSDWSSFTGECNTKDPDGYQHKCCDDASSGNTTSAPQEPCPTSAGLRSIVGISLLREIPTINFSSCYLDTQLVAHGLDGLSCITRGYGSEWLAMRRNKQLARSSTNF